MRRAIALLLISGAARASDATEGRLREALRSATVQLRALEDEKTAWQSKEGQLRKEADALRAELEAAKKAAGRQRRCEDPGAAGKLAAQAAESAKLAESLGRCEAAAKEAAESARARAEELAASKESSAKRIGACEAKNARMYRVGQEVLDWLSSQGIGAALMAREPFVGKKRVELENAAQDYEDRLLDERVKP